MPSWAAVLQQQAAEVAIPAAPHTEEYAGTTAVVDANAVIGGTDLRSLAKNLITVPEVLEECKDLQAQQRLQFLPDGIKTERPIEEAFKAVHNFAKQTGELHSLSRVDLSLIALAYTLEAAARGTSHLRASPAPPRAVKASRKGRGTAVPGWGDSGGVWDELDAIEDPDEPGENAASRIASQLQGLDLSTATAAADAAQPAEGAKAGSGEDTASSCQSGGDEHRDDDAGWQVALKSQSAARHRRQKETKRDQRAATASPGAAPSEASTAATASAVSVQPQAPAPPEPPAASPAQAPQLSATAEEQASASGSGSPSGGSCSESEGDGDDAASCQDSVSELDPTGDVGLEQPEQVSGISLVTADFAMQNVALQMGLRLVAPNGLQIRRLSRYALRCGACFKVCQEVGRVFCPQCGNAAMDKVEVISGPGGAQCFGTRKRHSLRGTRFSLPKPKGGKNPKQPVLREDQLLGKLRKQKAASTTEVDPFAPEYSPDTWLKTSGGAPAHAKGVAAAMAGWRRNPNERRHQPTNRRKK